MSSRRIIEMAPKKRGAPASASKPVQPKKTWAEKKATNKAEHKAVVEAGYGLAKTIIIDQKRTGQVLAARSLADIIGTPVEWSAALGEALFALVSTGHSMDEISKIKGMPSLFQMLKWLHDPKHPFSVTRARGKEMLVPLYEEHAHRVTTTANPTILKTRRQVVTKDGDVVWVTEKKEIDNVARSALAMQGLQWTLSHLMPKKHGRTPDPNGDKPNAQLEGLFAALKAGPAE